MLLFSIYFNLLLSYASGLIPYGYNFRTGRFVPAKPFIPLATVLLLVLVVVHNREGTIPTNVRIRKVGMQDIIHSAENFILKTNCILIAVLQLLYLRTYRRLLIELLATARAWEHRRELGRSGRLSAFVQLVLLPAILYLLHTFVYMGLVGWSTKNIVHALLSMVTLIPNMVHANNFYALLFVQRLTLGEINNKLANLWTICVRPSANRRTTRTLPVAQRLQRHLCEYQQCAGTLQEVLRLYSLPVLLYLLILLEELMSKLFYQFTYFHSLTTVFQAPVELECFGIVMVVLYGVETAQLISNCYGISEQSQKIKSSVHRLSLVQGQDKYFHGTVKSFLLSLNHSTLRITIAGMFTLDFEMLTGMIATISNFVVLLTQFHIDYSKHLIDFRHGNGSAPIGQ